MGSTKTKTGPASPLQVTGLTGGKNYHCRVRATNAVGSGPYSAYGADGAGRRRRCRVPRR